MLHEAFPTLRAVVTTGLVPLVEPLVDKQASMLPEHLAAVGAQIGHLARMNSLVNEKVGALSKTFPTVCTQMGPHPLMELLMFKEVGTLPEASPALRAGVRGLPSVDSQVNSKA